jgi:predicted ester cyclase
MITDINDLKKNSSLNDEIFNSIIQFYNAWETNNDTIIDELCSPDWEDIPLAPGQPKGPQGLKNLIAFFKGIFPDIKVIIRDVFGTTERVAVRGELVFTHNKAFMDIPPSNQKVNIQIFEMHHIRNGKITRTWHLEDWFGLLSQSIASKQA